MPVLTVADTETQIRALRLPASAKAALAVMDGELISTREGHVTSRAGHFLRWRVGQLLSDLEAMLVDHGSEEMFLEKDGFRKPVLSVRAVKGSLVLGTDSMMWLEPE